MKAVQAATTTFVRFLPFFAAWFSFVFVSFGFSARAAADDGAAYYLVRKHDTLTTILYSLGVTPMWGARGSVKRIIAHNDFIRAREKGGDLIFPGERILIPDDLQAKVERNVTLGFVTREDDGRVDFNCAPEGLAAWSLHVQSKSPDKDPFDPKSRTLALRCEGGPALAHVTGGAAELRDEVEVVDEPVAVFGTDGPQDRAGVGADTAPAADAGVFGECLDCQVPGGLVPAVDLGGPGAYVAEDPAEESGNDAENGLAEVADITSENLNPLETQETETAVEAEEIPIDDVVRELDERSSAEVVAAPVPAPKGPAFQTTGGPETEIRPEVPAAEPAPQTWADAEPLPTEVQADESFVDAAPGESFALPSTPVEEASTPEVAEAELPTEEVPEGDSFLGMSAEPWVEEAPSRTAASESAPLEPPATPPTEVRTTSDALSAGTDDPASPVESGSAGSFAPGTDGPSVPEAARQVHDTPAESGGPRRLTSRLGVLGSYAFSAHDSFDTMTGGSARLLSRPSLGYGLYWDQLWTPALESRVMFSGQRLVLRDTVQGQVRETSVDLTGLELSAQYRFAAFDLRLAFTQADEAYVRAPQAGSATVEGMPRTRLGLVFGKTFFEDDGLSLRITGGSLFGFATSTSDYTVNADRRDQLGLGVTQRLARSQIHFHLHYGQVSGSSSISTSTDRFVQGTLGMDFDLGGGAP